MTRLRTTSAYVAVLVAAGALYVVSCAPGALWQDSGLIQYRAWHRDIQGFLGLAIAHPLYYILAIAAGHLPFGEFGHRVNLLSSLAGAIAVANLFLLIRLWSGRNVPALVAAITLAFSHTFWRHASIAETYTLWTAIFTGELLVLLQYDKTRRAGYLYVLGLLNGLAVAVHMLGSIPLVGYGVLLTMLLARKTVRPSQAVLVALLWIVGALPFEYLIVRQMVSSGDVVGTLASVAFGDRWRGDVLNTSLSWQIVRENVLYFVLNFPTPNVLLFFTGCVALRRTKATRLFRNIVVAMLLLFFVFAFRYTVSDRYAFFIPFYTLVAVVIGVGVDAVQQGVRRKAFAGLMAVLAMLPPAVYAAAPRFAARTNLAIGTRADLAYRDDYTFFLQPWKTGYRGAERYASEVLETVVAEALIYADTTTIAPLLYVQEVKGKRSDVKIVSGIVRSEGAPTYGPEGFQQVLADHRVYVTSNRAGYGPPFVLGQYDLIETGPLWRVGKPVTSQVSDR